MSDQGRPAAGVPAPAAVSASGRAPLVSVVIPAYNCEKYLREAVDSVLAQTFSDYELIVVNDAATDSTPGIIAEYERTGSVRAVTHSKNRGLSAARNSGIREARGEYITFLDADDVWRPEKLEHQVKILKAHPELVLLGSRELFFPDGSEYEFPELPAEPRLRRLRWQDLLLGPCGLSPSNAIMKRDCFDEVGGFDESLTAVEDRDQWIRIVRRFGGAVDAGVVNAWRFHPDSMSGDPARMKSNKKRVLAKAFRANDCPLSLRLRAYAHMYLDIAITCYDGDRRRPGLAHCLKSCLVWPFPLGREIYKVPFTRWVWTAKCLLGRRLFEKMWGAIKGRKGARDQGVGAFEPAATISSSADTETETTAGTQSEG